ncbi:MAG: helix-turn-helix transcriptional regulator [Bacteroidota bacterium]
MNQIPLNNLPKGDNELKVIPLGHFTPYDYFKPHRHSYFEFFVFEKGGGSHFIDFVEYPILDCSVHIVFPQQIHLVKRNERASGSIIICSKHFMNLLGKFFYPQLEQNTHNAPCLSFETEIFSILKKIISDLETESKQSSVLSYNLTQNYTSIFLSHCIRKSAAIIQEELQTPNYSQHDWEVYTKFDGLVEQYFMEKATVAFYAQKMAMTAKVLNNCIRKVIGKTAVELLQEKTLIEAKRLLLHSDESIKEIAYKLNFKDSSYFTRFFTKYENQTPKEFKQYWEQKYHS